MCICLGNILISARVKALVELIVTLGMIFSGGILGLFALGFLSKRATRRGAYIGTGICFAFILWATVTGPLKVNLGLNFHMHPIMIGVFSHFILFGCGYIASLLFGGYRPELRGLTIGSRDQDAFEPAVEPGLTGLTTETVSDTVR
jgi:SSS family solute:Na+ symporter